METKVEQYLKKECRVNANNRLLLGVSGGVDSVVMAHVLAQLKQPFAIAHCNFKLRGEASNTDAAFVKSLAHKYKCEFYQKDFETETYVKQNKVSIQMAARDLRYKWFEDLRKENDFDFIVTAHHADDQLETILMNLVRGTGIKGLTGMKPKNNYIIRPMLACTKDEIVAYAQQQNIAFREDASNKETKYKRNKLRHKVLPILKELNPAIIDNISSFSQKMEDAQSVFDFGIDNIKKKVLKKCGSDFYLPFRLMEKYGSTKTILFEILKDFNFNPDLNQAVFEILNAEAGRKVCSQTHRVLKDRNHLIITPLAELNDSAFHQIEQKQTSLKIKEFKLKIEHEKFNADALIKNEKHAFFDGDKIEFPLTLRRWKAGDYFYPFGMTKPKSDKIGKKKLKRFFSDLKLSIRDKEQVWVLEDNSHKIIWVVGWRIDARVAANATTQNVVKMRLTHIVK